MQAAEAAGPALSFLCVSRGALTPGLEVAGLAAGLDDGLLPLCLPSSHVYRESLYDQHIAVANDSAPSYIQAAELRALPTVRSPRRGRHAPFAFPVSGIRSYLRLRAGGRGASQPFAAGGFAQILCDFRAIIVRFPARAGRARRAGGRALDR